MPVIADPTELAAPWLRDAYDYWHGKRDGRLMPARADIEPTEIPALLPFVMLVDVIAAPLDFRDRLIGTEARSLLRRDYTGLRFSEIAGKGEDSILWRGCAAVMREKLPVSDTPPYVGPERFLRNCENLLLPLSDDRVNVTMILKLVSFERRMSGATVP